MAKKSSKGTSKAKQCSKGYSCGSACINRNKACINPLEGQAKTYAEWLKANVGSGSLSPFHKEQAKALGLDSDGQGKKTEFASKWENAWSDAPDDLMGVINGLDQPIGSMLKPGEGGSYYHPAEGIRMGHKNSPEEGGLSALVWRHEYGHYLDDAIALKVGTSKLSDMLAKRGLDDFNTLKSKAESGDPKAEQDFSKLRTDLGITDPSVRLTKDMAARATLVKASPRFTRFYSETEAFKGAIEKDADTLIKNADKADKFYQNESSKNLGRYLEDEAVSRAVRLGFSDVSVGQAVATARTREEFTAKAKKEIIDRDYGGKDPKSPTLNSRAEFAAKGVLLNEIRSKSSNPIVRELAGKLSEEDTDFVELTRLHRTPNDPRVIADVAEKVYKSPTAVHDIIGSATLNKVGFGHSNEYYNEFPPRRYRESYANFVAMHGISKSDSLATRVTEHLMPNSHREFRNSLSLAQKAINGEPI